MLLAETECAELKEAIDAHVERDYDGQWADTSNGVVFELNHGLCCSTRELTAAMLTALCVLSFQPSAALQTRS